MKIAVIGLGRFGLPLALCFKRGGHIVYGVDSSAERVGEINARTLLTNEEHVLSLLKHEFDFKAHIDFSESVRAAQAIVITVQTPEIATEPYISTKYVSAILSRLNHLQIENKHIVIASTLPVGYTASIAPGLLPFARKCTVSYLPLIARNGSLVNDIMKPRQLVIGASNTDAYTVIQTIFRSVVPSGIRCVRLSETEAEMFYFGLSAAVMGKISMANAIGEAMRKNHYPPEKVLDAIAYDERVGDKAFRYGPAPGGPFLPRDTRYLAHLAKSSGTSKSLFTGVLESCKDHVSFQITERVEQHRTEAVPIHIPGCSYAAPKDVEDVTESNNVRVALGLAKKGIDVVVHDDHFVQTKIRDLVGSRVTYVTERLVPKTTEKPPEPSLRNEDDELFEEVARIEEEEKSLLSPIPQDARVAVVFGAGGFIGSALVSRLVRENYYVVGVDRRKPIFSESPAQQFIVADLTSYGDAIDSIPEGTLELYQLARDTTLNANLMINVNTIEAARAKSVKIVFYASSSEVYSLEALNAIGGSKTREENARPYQPWSEQGLLDSLVEQLYENATDLDVRIGRLFSVVGRNIEFDNIRYPQSYEWPVALCAAICRADEHAVIPLPEGGIQEFSFIHIVEAIEGIRKFVGTPRKTYTGPLNIGNRTPTNLASLFTVISNEAGKIVATKNHGQMVGSKSQSSDNRRIIDELAWSPGINLVQMISDLYPWVEREIRDRESRKVGLLQ